MRWRRIGLLGISVGLAGCNHVAYVYNATAGIDLTIGTEGTQRLAFGYDAGTFAIVPRFTPQGEPGKAEAMSLVSVSNVEAQGLEEIIFDHYIATGAAGRDAAQNPEALRMMRQAVFGNQQQ